MTEISRQPCPHPSCNSSDAFSYNSERQIGFCHSCAKGYPASGVKYSEENLVLYPLGELGVSEYTPTTATTPGKYIKLRGIEADVFEHYGVKTVVSPSGEPMSQDYVYPSGATKTRMFPKDFRASGKMDSLFGQNLFVAGSSKMVTIVEGELDALSAWQMVGRGSRYPAPIVSLPSANPSKVFWENVVPWLDSFEKIILSVDKDGAGDAVAQKINNIFPNKVYRVDHSLYKDANDFLMAGKSSEYKSAWFNAQRFMPDNILHSADDLLKLFDHTPDHSYVPTGIPEFDTKAMGLMQGHLTVFKAPTGIGKTELMRYLEWNFIQRGVTFATMHLEETKLRSVLGLVSYDLNDNLTRKDLVDEKGMTEEVRESIKRLGDSENYYQYFMKDGQTEEDLISQIRMFKEAYDCQFVMFEPIQDAVSTGSEENKEAKLAELAVRLSKVAADLNVGIITIAHTNDDGEVKYCKMIGQRASVIIRLDRDKNSDDIEDRNTTRLIIEKNRPTSEEGLAGEMLFDLNTFTMAPL